MSVRLFTIRQQIWDQFHEDFICCCIRHLSFNAVAAFMTLILVNSIWQQALKYVKMWRVNMLVKLSSNYFQQLCAFPHNVGDFNTLNSPIAVGRFNRRA